MFALTFLGTSASVPSAERNHPGLLVEAADQPHPGGLRGGYAAPVAAERSWLPKARPALADARPFRPRARHSGSVFDAAAAAKHRYHDDPRRPGDARSRRPDARRTVGRGTGRPSRCNSFRWRTGRVLDAGEFTVDCFRCVIATPKASVFVREPGAPASSARPPCGPRRAGRPGAQRTGGREAGDAGGRQDDRSRGRAGTARGTQETRHRRRHRNHRRLGRSRSGRRPTW